MDARTFVVDIDDNLIWSEKIECTECSRIRYKLIKIDEEEIKILNKLYLRGNTIILWTGRNWDCYKATKNQLKEAGILYHELVMGKPQGIYIDKDAKTSLREFLE